MLESRSRYETAAYLEANPSLHSEDNQFKSEFAISMLRSYVRPKSTFLEVGCGGGGILAEFCAAFDSHGVGIDISSSCIEHARARHAANDSLTFEVCDIAGYELKHDIGLMFDVFEHVEDYFGFLRTASSIAPIWVFNIPIDMFALAILTKQEMRWRREYGHLHSFSPSTARATLSETGYRIQSDRLLFSTLHSLRQSFDIGKLLLALPRLVLERVSPEFAARTVGPASLLVVASAPST
jgi:cyclopropane fatty-acyl-phospholipid synthase-like methyltransferase